MSHNEELIQVSDSKSNVWSVIRDIINTSDQEEAFYVCDIGNIVYKYYHWKNLMPRIKTYYAIKCNDHPLVLEVLAALGTGFDCASKGEIDTILALKVDPSRIIFANPTKPKSHIKYAADHGVQKMTFDNFAELEKVVKYYPEAELVLRIKYDDPRAKYQFGRKFGCDAKTEAPDLLRKAWDLNLNVVGVSFHIGSGSQTVSTFREAIRTSRSVFDIAAQLGFKFNLLDIGGGYPGAHGTSIKEIAQCINDAINLYFSDPSIQIISEPGQYYVDSAFSLVTNIHSIATTEPELGTGELIYMYYINTGVYSSLVNALFDQMYQPIPVNPRKDASIHKAIVWGPTCDITDKICDGIYLPKLEIDDWIVFENIGAYSITLSCNFNGFPIPKVHAVVDEKTWSLLKTVMSEPEKKFASRNCKSNVRHDETQPFYINFITSEMSVNSVA